MIQKQNKCSKIEDDKEQQIKKKKKNAVKCHMRLSHSRRPVSLYFLVGLVCS